MNWQPFDYRNFESGMFWLITETAEIDVDAGIDGSPVGHDTGATVRKPVLSWVEREPDGSPWFTPVEYDNHGYVTDDAVVTHFAPVIPPALPGQEPTMSTHDILKELARERLILQIICTLGTFGSLGLGCWGLVEGLSILSMSPLIALGTAALIAGFMPRIRWFFCARDVRDIFGLRKPR